MIFAMLAGALLALAPANGESAQPPGVEALRAARTQLVDNYDLVVRRMGLDEAADLEQRIDNDIGDLLSGALPDTASAADWTTRLDGTAALDSSLVAQVVAGRSQPLAGSRGLVERLVLTRTDHTLQPFALYVPSSAGPHPSLVILLHGNPQTETQLMSWPYFRELADSTGTIVAAPFGRGIYDFAPPADDEVYQVTDEVASAFGVDPHRIYLAGYSMGGFSVFKIGPEHPAVWAAVMCIAGSVLNSEAQAVRDGWSRTRMYIVNGSKDVNIPAIYGTQTAQWLAGVGIPTGFYQQPNGTHYLSTLVPVLTRAWREMLGGYIGMDVAPALANDAQLPAIAPASGTLKP
jgi:pimeloyl-ACP methyl ester carboxylesterase